MRRFIVLTKIGILLILSTSVALGCKPRKAASQLAGAPNPRSYPAITDLEQRIQQQMQVSVPLETGGVNAMAFEDTGIAIVTGSSDGQISLYQMSDQKILFSTKIEGAGDITAVDLMVRTLNGSRAVYVAAGTSNGGVYVGAYSLKAAKLTPFRKIPEAHLGTTVSVKWYDPFVPWQKDRGEAWRGVSLYSAGVDGAVVFNSWAPKSNSYVLNIAQDPVSYRVQGGTAARSEANPIKDTIVSPILDMEVTSAGQVVFLRNNTMQVMDFHIVNGGPKQTVTPVKMLTRQLKEEPRTLGIVRTFSADAGLQCRPRIKGDLEKRSPVKNDWEKIEDVIFVGLKSGKLEQTFFNSNSYISGNESMTCDGPSIALDPDATLGWQVGAIGEIAPVNRGKSLAISDDQGHVFLYNLEAARPDFEFHVPYAAKAFRISAPLNGLTFGTLAQDDNKLLLWKLNATYSPIKVSDTPSTAIDLSDDGHLLFSIGKDHKISAYDMTALAASKKADMQVTTSEEGGVPSIGALKVFRDRRACSKDITGGTVTETGPAYVLTAACNDAIDLWRVDANGGNATFVRLAKILEGKPDVKDCGTSPALEISDDHKFIFAGFRDGRIDAFAVDDLAAGTITAAQGVGSAGLGPIRQLAYFLDDTCTQPRQIIATVESREGPKVFAIEQGRDTFTAEPIFQVASDVTALNVWHQTKTLLISTTGEDDKGGLVAAISLADGKRFNLDNPAERAGCLKAMGQDGANIEGGRVFIATEKSYGAAPFVCNFQYPAQVGGFSAMTFGTVTREGGSVRFVAAYNAAEKGRSPSHVKIYDLGFFRNLIADLPPPNYGVLPDATTFLGEMSSMVDRGNLIFGGGSSGIQVFWGTNEMGRAE